MDTCEIIVVNRIMMETETEYRQLGSIGGLNPYVSFAFEYNNETTLDDLISVIEEKSNCPLRKSLECNNTESCLIMFEGVLYRFLRTDFSFKTIVDKYAKEGIIELFFFPVLFGRGGQVLKEETKNKGFRISIPSREGTRHHKPHVHARYYSGEEGTIDIITGEMIVGSLSHRQQKELKPMINSHQVELMKFWNSQTDGIEYDLSILLETKNLKLL